MEANEFEMAFEHFLTGTNMMMQKMLYLLLCGQRFLLDGRLLGAIRQRQSRFFISWISKENYSLPCIQVRIGLSGNAGKIQENRKGFCDADPACGLHRKRRNKAIELEALLRKDSFRKL